MKTIIAFTVFDSFGAMSFTPQMASREPAANQARKSAANSSGVTGSGGDGDG